MTAQTHHTDTHTHEHQRGARAWRSQPRSCRHPPAQHAPMSFTCKSIKCMCKNTNIFIYFYIYYIYTTYIYIYIYIYMLYIYIYIYRSRERGGRQRELQSEGRHGSCRCIQDCAHLSWHLATIFSLWHPRRSTPTWPFCPFSFRNPHASRSRFLWSAPQAYGYFFFPMRLMSVGRKCTRKLSVGVNVRRMNLLYSTPDQSMTWLWV